MRLCILGDAGSVHTKRWVEYFVASGWEVHLISLEGSICTKAYEHIFSPKVKIRWLKYLLATRRISDKIEKISPNIINAHFVPNYGLIGALVNRHPLVISCWGSDILDPPAKGILRKIRIKFALRRADLITTDAEMLKEAIIRLGIHKDKILNAPMGVDTQIFNPPPQKETPPLIVYLRTLEPIYNPELFIRAMSLVISEERVRIFMRSDGSMKNKIASLAKEFGIEIEFVSSLPQNGVAKILQSATIYVSTSVCDSTSVTLLEAMACGAFPIVTDIPGNREWIEDKINGCLVPVDNPNHLAKKIIEVLRNPKLLLDVATRNVKIVNERGVWTNNMSIIEQSFIGLNKR